MSYYIEFNGQPIGPMTFEQVFSYPVNDSTPVSRDGSPWAPLYTYPELMQRLHGSNSPQAYDQEISNKKTLCGIMAILFGAFGVQYFVLGKVGGGFITILLSIVTCGLWEIVMLIQGVMMLTMSNAEVEAKYINPDKTLPLF